MNSDIKSIKPWFLFFFFLLPSFLTLKMSQNELLTRPSTFSKEYNELIGQLTEQISASQPKDVVQFCFDFFHSRLSKEKTLTRQVDQGKKEGKKKN